MQKQATKTMAAHLEPAKLNFPDLKIDTQSLFNRVQLIVRYYKLKKDSNLFIEPNKMSLIKIAPHKLLVAIKLRTNFF